MIGRRMLIPGTREVFLLRTLRLVYTVAKLTQSVRVWVLFLGL